MYDIVCMYTLIIMGLINYLFYQLFHSPIIWIHKLSFNCCHAYRHTRTGVRKRNYFYGKTNKICEFCKDKIKVTFFISFSKPNLLSFVMKLMNHSIFSHFSSLHTPLCLCLEKLLLINIYVFKYLYEQVLCTRQKLVPCIKNK